MQVINLSPTDPSILVPDLSPDQTEPEDTSTAPTITITDATPPDNLPGYPLASACVVYSEPNFEGTSYTVHAMQDYEHGAPAALSDLPFLPLSVICGTQTFMTI